MSKFIAGEDIWAGDLVYVDDDRRVWRCGSEAHERGSPVERACSGPIRVTVADDIVEGQLVYLDRSEHAMTVRPASPTLGERDAAISIHRFRKGDVAIMAGGKLIEASRWEVYRR
jgi:hypothetical protein